MTEKYGLRVSFMFTFSWISRVLWGQKDAVYFGSAYYGRFYLLIALMICHSQLWLVIQKKKVNTGNLKQIETDILILSTSQVRNIVPFPHTLGIFGKDYLHLISQLLVRILLVSHVLMRLANEHFTMNRTASSHKKNITQGTEQ